MNRYFAPLCIGLAAFLLATAFFIHPAAAKAAPVMSKKAPAESFTTRKKRLLSDIDSRIDALRKNQDCITASKNKEAMRACLMPPAHHNKKPHTMEKSVPKTPPHHAQ